MGTAYRRGASTIALLAVLTGGISLAQPPPGYYDSAQGHAGEGLRRALNDIIDDHIAHPYSYAREGVAILDEDPNDSDNVILIYSQQSVPKTSWPAYNREHLWPQSLGARRHPAKSDLHHIFAADQNVNSSRGNKQFDDCLVDCRSHAESPDAFYDDDSWEPPDEVKGDIARALFYMDVRYEGEMNEPDLVLTDGETTSGCDCMSQLQTLLRWHAIDPVDDRERRRNDLIYSDMQENRNPFIDHPEWVRLIWGEVPEGVVVTPVPVDPTEITYVVGTWNLEHFHDGASRGFPENTRGGPNYPARTQADYEAIAGMIETMDAKILVLEEVFAEEVIVDGEIDLHSPEIEVLIGILGENDYDYVIGSTGYTQHIAILYDTRAARLNEAGETNIRSLEVQGKQIFDRQPLFGHFTFLHNGQAMNDLVVIGVHLASNQRLYLNHDRAMDELLDEIEIAREDEWCIPANENDILITGDFNATRFDNYREDFWDEMEESGWNVLADSEEEYAPTRLAGVPLEPRSVIDYVIVTQGQGGLWGEELTANTATVHSALVTDPETFRQQASDHIPVTVAIRVLADTD